MPHSAQPALERLNRARLITAAAVAVIAGVLRLLDTFPYPLVPFSLAVLATLGAGAIAPVARGMGASRGLVWLELILDVVLVSAITAVSGGAQSIFVPLYVLAVMAAAFLLPRIGAFAVSAFASALYVVVALGDRVIAPPPVGPVAPVTALEMLAISVNCGVFIVVALVTSSLANRYRESQRHLDTNRKHLSDMRAFRDQIFESVGSGLVAIDADGRVTAFNRAAESIAGVPASEALGQPWRAIFGDSVDVDDVRRAAELDQPLPKRLEFPLSRPDGRVIPVGISFWPLRSGRGDVTGLIGVCQDLSSIKQMEERVRQADRLATVGRLSANMAHEIRNPLASISGAVEALSRQLPPDEARDRLVEIVLKESERLNHIVAAFLEYARPAPLAPLDVNLSEVLDEVLLLIEHRSLPPNFKISREYPESLPARVDPQQMRQAVWNLCLNAVQAMPDGGELRVGGRTVCDPSGPRVQIWVSDTGQGISDKDLPHIFEPFYSTKAEGSGIGLALVYRVLQDHGGLIEARSRPGEGTTFLLVLPAAAEASPSNLQSSTARRP